MPFPPPTALPQLASQLCCQAGGGLPDLRLPMSRDAAACISVMVCHCRRCRRLVCWTWYDGRTSTQSSRLAAVTLVISGSSTLFTQLLNSFRPAQGAPTHSDPRSWQASKGAALRKRCRQHVNHTG